MAALVLLVHALDKVGQESRNVLAEVTTVLNQLLVWGEYETGRSGSRCIHLLNRERRCKLPFLTLVPAQRALADVERY